MLMTGAGREAAVKTPDLYRNWRADSLAAYAVARAFSAGASNSRLLVGRVLKKGEQEIG